MLAGLGLMVFGTRLPAEGLPTTPEQREQSRVQTEAELAQAESVLVQAEDAALRFSALQTVLRHASDHRILPERIERLLVRATADPDRRVSGLAERALYLRRYPTDKDNWTEEERRERSAARELEQIAAALRRRSVNPPDRFDPANLEATPAARQLAHRATSTRVWSPEVERLVRMARGHQSFEVARIGERLVAWREGRKVDPQFAFPVDPQAVAVRRAEREQVFGWALSEDPQIRREALFRLMDWALSDNLRPETRTRVRDLLDQAITDPDPRIAAYASAMITGLDGDEGALRQVYRSTSGYDG